MHKVKKLTKTTEFFLFIVVVVLCLLVQARSGQFFTGNNLVDLSRSLVIPVMFGVAQLLVIISGGIDVSCTAIASLSMYATTLIMNHFHYGGSIIVVFLVGAAFGLLMGSLNAVLIAYFRFPAMIVTLGTASIFTGIMDATLGAHDIPVSPSMTAYGKAKLFSATNTKLGLSSNMPVTVFLVIGLLILTFFILRYTMIGRGIFALGGDEVAAVRAGYNVFATRFFIYCFSGAVCGIIGITRACMLLDCSPTDMIGMEMTVIAAVVLGGARITGGVGTLTGMVLGTMLMTILSNSLILIGVPTYWKQVFTGAVIIIGTGVSAYQILKARRHPIVAQKE